MTSGKVVDGQSRARITESRSWDSFALLDSGNSEDAGVLVAGVKEGHANAVLAASIFHFGTYSVGEAKHYMSKCGIDMRLD